MEHRRIGSLEVSVVGLGCNNFGGRIDSRESAKVVQAALDSGINFFDTAELYGSGKSEEHWDGRSRGGGKRLLSPPSSASTVTPARRISAKRPTAA